MKNANLDKTIVFIDKKAEYEGKNRTYKLRLNELKGKNKIIGYQKHKKNKAHEAKKQKLLNSKLYKFRKRIIGTLVLVLSLLVISFLWNKFYKPSYTESNKYNFKVESDNLIFSKGYFTIPNKGDINFDMILQNYSPSALKINGKEYIKK